MIKNPSTHKALPCLLHVGQSKTGTTSIQATLFQELDDPGFVLISLDSFFGNQTLAGAFLPEPEAGKSFFLQRVPARRLGARKASARNWLDSGLRVARRRGAIPILSAEVVAGLFSEPAMQDLRHFLIKRGFSPRVIAYLRPPLDWIESGVQQLAKSGRTNLWSLTMDKLLGCGPWAIVERLDRVFGRENVELHLFDPDLFPDRCVVRHFCEQAGIPLPEKIIRENDSLNINALKFVHAYNRYALPGLESVPSILRRMLVIKNLEDLPGPPLRLHPQIYSSFLGCLVDYQPMWQERMGRPLPATLIARESDQGLRAETDLDRFEDEALDWLGRKLGVPVKSLSGSDRCREVALSLDRLVQKFPANAMELIRDKCQLRLRRLWRQGKIHTEAAIAS
jgi:hypothetical protein